MLAEDMGEIRDDYSGRGMFGKSEHAVVFDNHTDFHRALVFAAFELGQDGSFEDPESFLLDLGNLRLDSMGLGIVVY